MDTQKEMLAECDRRGWEVCLRGAWDRKTTRYTFCCDLKAGSWQMAGESESASDALREAMMLMCEALGEK